MKHFIILFALVFQINSHAQLLVDDFSGGTMETQFFTKKSNSKLFLKNNKILGILLTILKLIRLKVNK